MILNNKRITKALNRLHGCPGWSVHLLFANPKDRFSCVMAHMNICSLVGVAFDSSSGVFKEDVSNASPETRLYI